LRRFFPASPATPVGAATTTAVFSKPFFGSRTGSPWRDLHPDFGLWNSIFRRFRRWATKGVFEILFHALSGDPDFEYAMIDGTIVRVHQHGAGAKGGLKIRRLGDRAEV
jgi:transposase